MIAQVVIEVLELRGRELPEEGAQDPRHSDSAPVRTDTSPGSKNGMGSKMMGAAPDRRVSCWSRCREGFVLTGGQTLWTGVVSGSDDGGWLGVQAGFRACCGCRAR